MKRRITPLIIVGMLCGVAALVCFVISIFQNGNNPFLMVGAGLIVLAMILMTIQRKMM